MLTATSSPGIARQSSAARPVLNALVHEQIQVPDTGGVVVIVYDVGLAFIQPQAIDPASTDSGFIFSPVLRATDAMRTGPVAGAVRAGSDAGAPVADASLQLYLGNPAWPENTWSTMATARTDSTGTFRFAFVTPSAYWAQFPARASDVYIVVVDPPAGSGLGWMLDTPDVGAGLRLGVLAALAGFLVAGFFEWNFGDEELLYLLYTMVGMAWAARAWKPQPLRSATP